MKGALLDLLTYILLQNFKNQEEGDPLETFKNFRKNVAQRQKKYKRHPLGMSGFLRFLDRVKNERGTHWTKFALAGLGLRWFQETDQCQDRSLKKNGHYYNRAFFLKRKKRRLKKSQ